MDSDPLLDVNEVASYLGVTSRTVYREHKRGRLRFLKVGALTRVRRSELDRYLRAAERDAA